MSYRKPCVAVFALAVMCAVVPSLCAETLRNPYRIPTPIDPASVAVGDLNGDGIADFVWGDSTSQATLHILLSQPGGGWASGQTIPYPIVTTTPPVCLIADFNGDGHQDLVCASANQSTAYVHLFPGNGDGTLNAPTAAPLALISPSGFAAPQISLVGDLNRDGFPDLYLIDAITESAHVLLGDGTGSFKAPIFAPNGINGVLPIVADVNGDGIPDLLFPQGPEVALGKGDGSFAPIISYAETSYYSAICAFHDMDGDGHLDAVCGYEETIDGDINGASDLIILHGNPDGSFNTTPIARKTFGDRNSPEDGLGTFQTPIAVSDLNGDGTLDIVATAGDGLTVLLGKGHLTYGSPAHYAQAVVSSQQVSPHYQSIVSDVNGDGIPDIVNTGPNGIYISYGNHDGTYNSAFAPEVAEVITYPSVADFNGDGIPDIVAAGDTALKLSIGKGDGTFANPLALPNNGAIDYSDGRFFSDVLHGDFNGDGKQDLFAAGVFKDAAGNSAGGFFLYFGNGDGTFANPVQVSPNPDFIFDAQALNASGVWDINGDGRDDLLVQYSDAPTGKGVLQVDLSNGDGSFKIVSNSLPLDIPGAFSIAAIADFNGDGKQDAVYGSQSNAYFVKGNGDGSFDTTPIKIAIPPLSGVAALGASAAAAGDFDGDGIKDFVLLVDYSSGNDRYFPHPNATAAWVYYGNGDGTFSAPVLAGAFNHNFYRVGVADLNQDGLTDIILLTVDSGYGEFAVGVVHASPGRTFGPEIDYTAGTGDNSMAVADLNRDGFPDLVFGNGGTNTAAGSVTVLMNLGNTLTVTGTLLANPEPSTVGSAFTLTATLTPPSPSTLPGSVSFLVQGKSVGSAPLIGNQASISLPGNLAAGSYASAATWPGDSTFAQVSLSGIHRVVTVGTQTTLTSSLNPSPAGSSVTFTATVTPASGTVPGTPTGTVTFNAGKTASVPLVNGVAAFTTATLPTGQQQITATYSGDATFSASSASLTQTVTGLPSTVSLTTQPNPAYADQTINASVAVTTTGSHVPAGVVALNVDGAPLTIASLNAGKAAIEFSLGAPGKYTLTASYAGDAVNSPGTSPPLVQTVLINPTTSVITGATSPALAFHPIVFTAAVTSTTVPQSSPVGTVTFFAGTTSLGSAVASSALSFTTSALAAGVYSITAVYSGSKGFAPSTSAPFPLTVERAPSAITISSSANPAVESTPVTFTATVSGPPAPAGSVTFADNGKPLGAPVPVDSDGVAAFTTATLTPGKHPITAAYPGDANLLPVTTPPLEQSILVNTGNFDIHIAPASATRYTGESATFGVAVTSTGGFHEPLALSCVGLPAATTCTFSSSTLPNGSGTSTLTLQTNSPHQAASANSSTRSGPEFTPRLAGSITAVAALIFLFLPSARRVRSSWTAWTRLLALLLFVTSAACGCITPTTGGTPPGTYKISVTAQTTGTGQPLSHSAVLTLTVKSLF